MNARGRHQTALGEAAALEAVTSHGNIGGRVWQFAHPELIFAHHSSFGRYPKRNRTAWCRWAGDEMSPAACSECTSRHRSLHCALWSVRDGDGDGIVESSIEHIHQIGRHCRHSFESRYLLHAVRRDVVVGLRTAYDHIVLLEVSSKHIAHHVAHEHIALNGVLPGCARLHFYGVSFDFLSIHIHLGALCGVDGGQHHPCRDGLAWV